MGRTKQKNEGAPKTEEIPEPVQDEPAVQEYLEKFDQIASQGNLVADSN